MILVDTRGTGLSQLRLGCPEFDRAGESTFRSLPYIGSSAVPDFTQATIDCRDRLTAAGIDLSAHNTAESAADLDALRRALGYRRWNLIALSAHGVLGLTFMRLFPSRIRSSIVDSGASPHHLWGLDYVRGLNEVLESVFAGCAACRDLVGFITRADLEQAARDLPELASYFLDPNYDIALPWSPESPAGCRLWNVGVAEAAQHEPVSSLIPTLVLADEYDAGIPPFMVRQISPTLPNSFYYESRPPATSSSPTSTRPAPAHGRLRPSSSTGRKRSPTRAASRRCHRSTSRRRRPDAPVRWRA